MPPRYLTTPYDYDGPMDQAPGPLPILFSDDRFVVVAKPSGLLVHRSSIAADRVTLLQLLRDQIGCFVYPAHRLDRPASGAIAFALSGEDARFLQAALQAEDACKEYLVMCRGETAPEFISDRPLTSDRGVAQEASTSFERIAVVRGFSLLRARLATGRRHQIRRHLAHLGHQVVGDTKYGKGGINRWLRSEFGLERLFLHAARLRCAFFDVRAPLAPDLTAFLDRFASRGTELLLREFPT